MLTLFALTMVAIFMFLIMTKHLPTLITLILVPTVFALIGSFAAGLDPMMPDGIRTLAPAGVVLMLVILYFVTVINSGLFNPAVCKTLRLVRGDPLKISLGTAALAIIVSLDGDGSTVYMICVVAMLPLYSHLGTSPLVMACLTILSNGVFNITPWGGLTTHTASILHVGPADILVPMTPAVIVGLLAIFAITWIYGKRERARFGELHLPTDHEDLAEINVSQYPEACRPRLLWFNAIFTVVLMVTLIVGPLPMLVLFMITFGIAMTVNYSYIQERKKCIDARTESIPAVASLVLVTGVFAGIFSGTGMVDTISRDLLAMIPPVLGPYLATIIVLVNIPFIFFVSNDAFCYGIPLILIQVATGYGITPVEMAHASTVDRPVHLLSPLASSTHLPMGLAKIDFGDHRRFILKWIMLVRLAILIIVLLLGLFPLSSNWPRRVTVSRND